MNVTRPIRIGAVSENPETEEGFDWPNCACSIHSETGQSKEISDIYTQEVAYVWNSLQRLGVAYRDLEDSVHDVFVVLFKNWNKYDTSRPVRPWLCGIAARVASDYRRKARHRREQLSGDASDHMKDASNDSSNTFDITAYSSGQNPELKLEHASDRQMILKALNTLSEEQRNVFVLHDVEGFSVPEIVKMTETPLNTLYSQLRLARDKFVSSIRQQQTLRGEK